MPEQPVIEKAKKLRSKINDADYKYYVLAEPDIDDYAYDMMMNELLELENKYPELKTPDSPTQRVGGTPTKDFPTVIHEVPMLSLSNSYNEEELIEFDERIKKALSEGNYKYSCEMKFDGIAVSLLYENGLFVKGATRGDGYTGDEVTNNLKTVRSIPLRIDNADKKMFPLDIEVRGEVFLTKEIFQKINEEQMEAGLKTYANPRNTAAGTLKLKDSKIVARRNLNIFVYSLRFRNETQQSMTDSHFET